MHIRVNFNWDLHIRTLMQRYIHTHLHICITDLAYVRVINGSHTYVLAPKQVVFPGALWITGNKTGYLWGEVVLVLIICIFFLPSLPVHSPRCAPYDWLTARILSRLILSASELVSICSFMLRLKKSQIEQLCQAQLDFTRKTTGKKRRNNNIQCHCSLIPASNLPFNTHTLTGREITALSQRKWFTKANLNTDVSDRSTLDFLWDKRRDVSHR